MCSYFGSVISILAILSRGSYHPEDHGQSVRVQGLTATTLYQFPKVPFFTFSVSETRMHLVVDGLSSYSTAFPPFSAARKILVYFTIEGILHLSDTTFRFTLGESGFMVASDGLWAVASWAEIQLRGAFTGTEVERDLGTGHWPGGRAARP